MEIVQGTNSHASLALYINLNIDTIKSLWFQGILFFKGEFWGGIINALRLKLYIEYIFGLCE